jgi:hypothetical protein
MTSYEQPQLFEFDLPQAKVERQVEFPLYQPYKVTDGDRTLIQNSAQEIVSRWDALLASVEASGITGSLWQNIYADEFYKREFPDHELNNDRVFAQDAVTLNEDGTKHIKLSPYTLTTYGSEESKNDPLLMLRAKHPEPGLEVLEFCATYLGAENAEAYTKAASEFCDEMFEARFMGTDEVLRVPLNGFGKRAVSAYFPGNEQALQDWEAFICVADLTAAIIGENADVMDDTLVIALRFVSGLILDYEKTGMFYHTYALGDKKWDPHNDESAESEAI